VSRSRDTTPTMTSPAMTDYGIILGTAGYMSPEQAKGKPVDKRADIWAFGVVLYEMLTGRRLFSGETVSETLASVIKDEPSLDRLPSDTPPNVRRLLRRCLERDPRQRLRDIGEARIALAAGTEEMPAAPALASVAPRRAVWLVAAAGILLAVSVGAIVSRARPETPVPVRRFELAAEMASAHDIALSPDGSRVAYLVNGALRLRSLDQTDARGVATLPPGAGNLFWSPDSQTIGFTAEGTIRSMPAAGGAVFTICRVPASGRVLGITWRRDGTIVFSVWRDSLYEVPAIGGSPRIYLAIDPATEVDFHSVWALPDGRVVLRTHLQERGVDSARIEIFDGARRTLLMTDPDVGAVAYAPPDHLLFLRSGANAGLWTVPFQGRPVDLTKAEAVQPGADAFDVAGDGTLLVRMAPATAARDELIWMDRTGKASPAAGAPVTFDEYSGLSLSPDGRRAVTAAGSPPRIGTDQPAGMAQIVVRDLQSGVDTPLTFDQTSKMNPSWFASGDRVLYTVEQTVQDTRIVSRRSDGSGDAHQLTNGVAARVSPDGRELLYTVDNRGRRSLRRARIQADGTPGQAQPVFHGAEDPDVRSFDLSPDGRLLAYAGLSANLQLDVYLTEYPTGDGRWQVTSGGTLPQFSHDGRELFYMRGTLDESGKPHGRMMAVPVTSRPTVMLGAGKPLFDLAGLANSYGVSPDGQRFLMARPFAQDTTNGPRLVLIQNGLAALGGSR
jgi:eukaryotic-like serine/threonine-protein kinase